MSSNESLNDILSAPNRRSLADDVVERLREAIRSGGLKPGMRLREEELADFLKVSRGPIREALVQLEREGLVIKQPNRSAVVARLSSEDLEEVYSLRLALEQLAVRQAVKNASDRHFAALEQVVSDMATALERGITEQEAAELDVQFHEVIYQAAGHRRLYDCWSLLRPQIHIFLLSRNVANADFRDYILGTHEAILDAIRNRDEARSLRLITEHLQAAYERVRSSQDSKDASTD